MRLIDAAVCDARGLLFRTTRVNDIVRIARLAARGSGDFTQDPW